MTFRLELHNNDLEHWVCSLTGEHTVTDPVPRAFTELPWSPLLSPSVLGWATQGNTGRDIALRIRTPDAARQVFPARFLRRFELTREQCGSIIRKRIATVRNACFRETGAKPSRRRCVAMLLTVARRRRKQEDASDSDENDENEEGEEGEEAEGCKGEVARANKDAAEESR